MSPLNLGKRSERMIDRTTAIKHLRRMAVEQPHDMIIGKERVDALEMAVSALCENCSQWIGDYAPYLCPRCGKYSDTKTLYCAYCGEHMECD